MHQPQEMVKHTQTIRQMLTKNCLNVFDHFVGSELKRLTARKMIVFDSEASTTPWDNLDIHHIRILSDAYSEPSQISTMELFCKDSSQFLAIDYFRKKNSIIDIWQCPKYLSLCYVL